MSNDIDISGEPIDQSSTVESTIAPSPEPIEALHFQDCVNAAASYVTIISAVLTFLTFIKTRSIAVNVNKAVRLVKLKADVTPTIKYLTSIRSELIDDKQIDSNLLAQIRDKILWVRDCHADTLGEDKVRTIDAVANDIKNSLLCSKKMTHAQKIDLSDKLRGVISIFREVDD